MRTMITALVAITIATSACKKEHENIDTRIPEKEQRLSSYLWSNENTAIEKAFKYNSSGYLSEVVTQIFHKQDKEYVPTSTFSLVYQRDKADNVTATRLYDEISEEVEEYVYEGEKPVRINYIGYGSVDRYDTLVWYKGKLVSVYSFEGKNVIGNQRLLYDAEGNLQEALFRRSKDGYTLRCYNIRYDNMPNVMNAVMRKPYELPIDMTDLVPRANANNIIAADFERKNLNDKQAWTWVYHLSYDEKGRVIKSVKNNGQETIEYFYEEY